MTSPISFYNKVKTGFRNKINKSLKGTHNHFLSHLPEKTGFISYSLLRLFFFGIKLNERQINLIKEANKEGIIVYTSKYKKKFDFLFFFTRYKQKDLPVPEIGLGYRFFLWLPLSHIYRIILSRIDSFFINFSLPHIYKSGYVKEELLKGKAALLPLIDKKGFYRRFVKQKHDPLQYLIEMQASIEKPIFLIPQLIFFSKNPHKASPSIFDILFGTEENPGIIRRSMMLIRKPGKIFVEISDPLNLKSFLELPENKNLSVENLSLSLRRCLVKQTNRHRQSVTGPVLKNRLELRENILTNPRLMEYMLKHAEKKKITVQQARKEAAGYFDEIAANYNAAFLKIAARLAGWILNSIFEKINLDYTGLQNLKNAGKQAPLILVPCHKSHIDYLVLPYILYQNNLPCPHTFAGKNLFFWPFSIIIRALGAFSIRRTFKGAAFYSKVFAEYINILLLDGFNLQLYVEGGRSRTGKLIMPKLGSINIVLNANKHRGSEDLMFVPIFIGYDRVLEEKSYLDEIKGGKKEPENLSQVFKARKFLKKKYGKIYINFSKPISLNGFASKKGVSVESMATKEQNMLCRDLGNTIIFSINKLTVVTPHSVVASTLLNYLKKNINKESLLTHAQVYMNYLQSSDVKFTDTLKSDPEKAIINAFEEYIQRKFLIPVSGDEEETVTTLYIIDENSRANLEYYKNNSISFFIPAAFTAISILAKEKFQFTARDLLADYITLQELYKFEFVYDPEKKPEYFIRKSIKTFINESIIIPHSSIPETYDLTSVGLKKLKFFANFLKPYLESYWIVINFLKKHSDGDISIKDRIKKIQTLGNRMYKNSEIERKEALSKINYQNSVDYFSQHGLRGSEHTEKIKHYSEMIEKYLGHLSI